MVVEPGEGGGCEEEHTALSSTGGGARGEKIRKMGSWVIPGRQS